MNIHTDTLAIVRSLIRSFYNQHMKSPLILDIFHALEHPEMLPYQDYFLSLIQDFPPIFPINYTAEGWLAIEVVDNPKCYSLISTNSSPAR